MVKKMFFPAAVLLITLCLGSAFAAGPNMNPGKWEITTQTEMAGMPMSIPAVTHTQCITGDELIPQSQDANKECVVSDMETKGYGFLEDSLLRRQRRYGGHWQGDLQRRYHGRNHGYGHIRCQHAGQKQDQRKTYR